MNTAEEAIKKQYHDHSDNGLLSYASILEDICQEDGIQISWLSNNWVALLEKNGQKEYIVGYKFGLNPASNSLLADDKFATFEALRANQVPVIEHALLYEENNTEPFAKGFQSRDYIKEFLQKHNNHIVIKPNDGFCGINVYQVRTMDEVDAVLPKIFHQSFSASMCPFYEIKHEFRFIMLDGEVRLAYMKERGKDWRFNLSEGAKAVKIDDLELYKKLESIALQAVKTLGLRLCSVDIIETITGELAIMEVNTGIMTKSYIQQHPEDYTKVKQIYADAIRKMFAEN